jgi:hypothetical protein
MIDTPSEQTKNSKPKPGDFGAPRALTMVIPLPRYWLVKQNLEKPAT